MNLIEMLTELRKARAEAEEARGAASAMLEAVANSDKYKAHRALHLAATTHAEFLEKDIRALAVANYAADQNKKPGNGIEIKMFQVATILDEQSAREWALHNFTPALKLDVKVFEKAAIAGSIPSNLATVTEEPRAFIATNLSPFLDYPHELA